MQYPAHLALRVRIRDWSVVVHFCTSYSRKPHGYNVYWQAQRASLSSSIPSLCKDDVLFAITMIDACLPGRSQLVPQLSDR